MNKPSQEVQRYELYVDYVGGEMLKQDDGDWVQFEDHERILKQVHKDYGCEVSDPNGTIWEHAENVTKENEQLKWLLGQIIQDLPQNNDWLNPDLEREAEELIE